MVIKEITLKNFRSYYGEQSIEPGDNLTIIIGNNGDGKTTFYDAIDWLFNTSPTAKADINHISQKRLSEMTPGESDEVSVSIDFEHDGLKSVSKSFVFKKDYSGDVSVTQFKFEGLVENGSERQLISGRELIDRCFHFDVRKYHLFKGETEINVFGNEDAVESLINRFSEVKQFLPFYSGDAYNKGFMEYAVETANKNLDRIRSDESRSNKKLQQLSQRSKTVQEALDRNNHDHLNYQRNYQSYSKRLEDLEAHREASNELREINEILRNLQNDKIQKSAKIVDDFSTKLLDDSWILYGIIPTLDKYRAKIVGFRNERQKIISYENRREGRKEVLKEIADGMIPIDPLVPDRATMEDMIKSERCKVCGTPAPKGSDAYNFMVKKLNQLLESLEPKDNIEESVFPNNYLEELYRLSTNVDHNTKEINELKRNIFDEIEFNTSMQLRVKAVQDKIDQVKDRKLRLLAQTDGVTESELVNAYENISNWNRDRSKAEKEMQRLKFERDELEREKSEIQEQMAKLSKDPEASAYAKISNALTLICDAFKYAQEKNTRDFLKVLEDLSNEYLTKLNLEGFHGIIRIVKNFRGATIVLTDEHGINITKPNQALLTTVYMSVLFAIAQLTAEKSESEYPLVFDAPTSSFSAQTESDFYNVITTLKKQCIIVTKSFLLENGTMDNARIKDLNCKVYRMEKKKPFVATDLSTIQTSLTLIKE